MQTTFVFRDYVLTDTNIIDFPQSRSRLEASGEDLLISKWQ